MPATKKTEAELFEYRTKTGVLVQLPPLPRLTNKDMRALRRSSLYDQCCTLAEKYATDKQMEVFDEVPLDEMTDLANAWMEFSTDLTLGE